MRAMTPASGTFLGGMTTYVAKLGPDILGRSYSGFIDRKVAAGLGSVSFRLRLRDIADRLAEELIPRLAARQGRSLRMLSIGGGPAMDSLNALILVRKSAPESLDGRRVFIRVLDVDKDGPAFGSRATEALRGGNAPLYGVSISFDRLEYDWTRPSDLHSAVGKIDEDDVVIGSTEGGLFEYGSDEVVVGNLRARLGCTPSDTVIVGSIVRDGQISRSFAASSRMTFRSLAIEDSEALASSAGGVLDRVKESRPVYCVVSLKKAGSPL